MAQMYKIWPRISAETVIERRNEFLIGGGNEFMSFIMN